MKKLIGMMLATLLLAVTLPASAQAGTANIRVAHFSADAPAVDVYIDGELVISELDFPEVSEWTGVEPGTYTIAVTPAGANDAVIGPAEFTFAEGEFVTIAAIGLVGNNTLTAQALVEDYSPTNDGETRISVFHAIQDAGPVDVSANGNTLVRLLAYPNTIVAEGDGFDTVDVLAAEYDISVALNETGDEIFSIEDITMGQNRNYFIAAVGTAANPQFVLVTTDMATLMAPADMGGDDMGSIDVGEGIANLRVAHFSPGAPPVDIYLNGTLVVRDLAFPSVTDYLDVNADVYEVLVVEAGAVPTEGILDVEVPIAADSVNLVAAVGILEQGTFSLQLVNENPDPINVAEARVSVFNAVPSDEGITLTANDTDLVANLFFPQLDGASDGYASTDVIAQAYDLSVTSDEGSVDINIGEVVMGSGRHYFVAIVGLESAPLFILETSDVPGN